MYEVELYESDLLMLETDLDHVPAVGEVFEAEGFQMTAVAVQESDSGSDYRIDIEHVF
jgi:hypothetical protein